MVDGLRMDGLVTVDIFLRNYFKDVRREFDEFRTTKMSDVFAGNQPAPVIDSSVE